MVKLFHHVRDKRTKQVSVVRRMVVMDVRIGWTNFAAWVAGSLGNTTSKVG